MSNADNDNSRPVWMAAGARFISVLSVIVFLPLLLASVFAVGSIVAGVPRTALEYLLASWWIAATLLAGINFFLGIRAAKSPTKGQFLFLLVSSAIALMTCPVIWA